MKSTGIVRRIDDLGRVVIPKDIRRYLCIKDGDPLELFLDGEIVCFQKYTTTNGYEDTIDRLIEHIKEEDSSVPNKKTAISALELAKELLGGSSNECQ